MSLLGSETPPLPRSVTTTSAVGRGARVLLIEDEDAIRTALTSAFSSAGHTVRALADGTDLEAEVDAFRPDLALLDVMVPGRDGFELTRVLRGRTDAVVLLLTARDELPDRLRGFDVGADDYVTKPFAIAEVLARSTALLRRLGRIADCAGRGPAARRGGGSRHSGRPGPRPDADGMAVVGLPGH
jgi:DNA-binding response OmpR family regulator